MIYFIVALVTKIILVNDLITLLAPSYANKPLTYSLVGSIDSVSEKRDESNLISVFVWKAFGTNCIFVWCIIGLVQFGSFLYWWSLLHCTFSDSTFQGILAHLWSDSVTICIYPGTFYVCVHCYVGFYTWLINFGWFLTFSW